ncbi:MAG: hypothetical protein M0Z55_00065 [Peptococcaceae bacterium]|nr:hypothetical protein [Peptococcaceae bacterium]
MTTDNFMIADGDDAKRLSEQSSTPATKHNYVKLKAGESLRVILLDAKFPNYYGHGDFAKKIPSHVCTAPRAGMPCLSCDAEVKRSVKYLVPLYDVDKKEVIIWDTSKTHVSSVYAIIDTYGEDVCDEIFQLKRTGAGAKDTSYSFIPLPPKQKAAIEVPADIKPFEYGSQERSDFYASILRAPTEDWLKKIIGNNQDVASAEGQGDEHGF